jgi:hypothetical protein
MSEKKLILKASDEQWEIFLRAWAKDVRPENWRLLKNTKVVTDRLDHESHTIKINYDHLVTKICDAPNRQSETYAVQFLQDMHSTIKDVFEERQVDPVIRRTGLYLDSLLPPSRADDAILNLEAVYYSRWLPKYGPRTARRIFAVQGAGTILGFWGPRIIKWLAGTLGLLKLFGWFSGLRGG